VGRQGGSTDGRVQCESGLVTTKAVHTALHSLQPPISHPPPTHPPTTTIHSTRSLPAQTTHTFSTPHSPNHPNAPNTPNAPNPRTQHTQHTQHTPGQELCARQGGAEHQGGGDGHRDPAPPAAGAGAVLQCHGGQRGGGRGWVWFGFLLVWFVCWVWLELGGAGVVAASRKGVLLCCKEHHHNRQHPSRTHHQI